MPYFSGTTPASGTPSKDFMEGALHTALVSCFAFVEEVPGSSNYTHRVYQAPGGWFLVATRTSDVSTTVYLATCERYATGVAERLATAVNSSQALAVEPGPPSYGYSATTKTLASSGVLVAQSSSHYLSVSASGSQFWLSVTDERAVLAVRSGASDYAIYLGMATAINPGIPVMSAAVYAVLLNGWDGANSADSREPGITVPGNVSGGLLLNYNPEQNIRSSSVGTYSNKYPSSVIQVYTGRTGNERIARLVDILTSNSSGTVSGDTATIDGRPYVCVRWGSTSTVCWIDSSI